MATTTTTKKMTKAEKFALLRKSPAVAENEMLVEFIDHEVELLNRKNSSGEKKLTKTQVANEEIKTAIYNGMAENRMYSITEIQKEIPACAELTNQKVTALIRQMIPVQVQRIEDKRKAYFRKVVAVEE